MTALPAEEPRGFVPRADLYAALRRVDALKAERDELRAKLDAICGANLGAAIVKLGFAKCEAALLAALLARPLQPTAALIAAYQADRSDAKADIDNLVKVRICNTRRRIRSLGGPADAIQTLWASGYALTDAGRAWLQGCLDGVSS